MYVSFIPRAGQLMVIAASRIEGDTPVSVVDINLNGEWLCLHVPTLEGAEKIAAAMREAYGLELTIKPHDELAAMPF